MKMVDYRCMSKDLTIRLLGLPENNNPSRIHGFLFVETIGSKLIQNCCWKT